MKKKLGAFMMLLLLSGCATQKVESDYQLYFCSSSEQAHGSAIVAEDYAGAEVPTVEQLMDALLQGPEQDTLRSPFPKGLTMRSWNLDEGLLTIQFSEHYGGLTDIDLTLADYCVVLTMTQLQEVELVQIQSVGQDAQVRSHPMMSGDEVLEQLSVQVD